MQVHCYAGMTPIIPGSYLMSGLVELEYPTPHLKTHRGAPEVGLVSTIFKNIKLNRLSDIAGDMRSRGIR
jgi:hypothetical protein